MGNDIQICTVANEARTGNCCSYAAPTSMSCETCATLCAANGLCPTLPSSHTCRNPPAWWINFLYALIAVLLLATLTVCGCCLIKQFKNKKKLLEEQTTSNGKNENTTIESVTTTSSSSL